MLTPGLDPAGRGLVEALTSWGFGRVGFESAGFVLETGRLFGVSDLEADTGLGDSLLEALAADGRPGDSVGFLATVEVDRLTSTKNSPCQGQCMFCLLTKINNTPLIE